jgi:hypothetical protein
VTIAVDLTDLERRKNELDFVRHDADDEGVLRAEMNQPKRDNRSVIEDLEELAETSNSAPLAFWEACSNEEWFLQEHHQDFVGLAATLGRVEDDSFNRYSSDFHKFYHVENFFLLFIIASQEIREVFIWSP